MGAGDRGAGGDAGPGSCHAEPETPDQMRAAIIDMVLASVRRFVDPAATIDSVRGDPAHRAAFLATLEDCRPLPVVRAILADMQAGRL